MRARRPRSQTLPLNPGYIYCYWDRAELEGRVAAPSVGASPTATGAAGCGLAARPPTVDAGARPSGERRGGTGAVAGRGLPSPDAAADCPFGGVAGFWAGGSGAMMLTGGMDCDDGKS